MTAAESAVAAAPTITAPASRQVIQRSGSTGTITISGAAKNAVAIEARFNGGSWATIATSAGNVYSGSLTGQAQGQGTLEVRYVGQTAVSSVTLVGIGDIYVIAGQSNPSGRGTNNQSYSGTPSASLFGNDYLWHDLTDPTDTQAGQVDSVSADVAGGSIWPLVATSFLTDQGVPIAFVPAAKGGSSITAWQPGASHIDRSTLYGSMVFRAQQQQGGVKSVLWWQGETDAINGMTQATYESYLTALADAINADLGCKLIPCKLQHFTSASQASQDVINAAIGARWTAGGNVLTGPDLTGLDTTPEDINHLTTNAKLSSAAGLWWTRLQALFY